MTEERAKHLAELVAKTKSAANPDDMQNTGGDMMRKFTAVIKNQKEGQPGSWTTYGNVKINMEDPGFIELMKEYYTVLPAAAVEVHPNLFIGNIKAVKNLDYLKGLGITHIVNTAEGNKAANVTLDVDQLEANGLSYFGCECNDSDDANIAQYFKATGDFIESALSAGGKVVVNCWGGKSRSSTITLAFLIQKTNLSLEDAIVQVKLARTINPNLSFLTALVQLEESLLGSK